MVLRTALAVTLTAGVFQFIAPAVHAAPAELIYEQMMQVNLAWVVLSDSSIRLRLDYGALFGSSPTHLKHQPCISGIKGGNIY